MAKKDRTGNRKTRDQRKQFKVPELGYYLIVTDTEATERCFFKGLHQALPEDVRNKLVIKVVETKTRAMIDKCLELTAYDAQYRIPWEEGNPDPYKLTFVLKGNQSGTVPNAKKHYKAIQKELKKGNKVS